MPRRYHEEKRVKSLLPAFLLRQVFGGGAANDAGPDGRLMLRV
jgi:hypothetical protein